MDKGNDKDDDKEEDDNNNEEEDKDINDNNDDKEEPKAQKAAIYVEVGARRAPKLLSQTSHLNIIVIKCTNITQFPRTNS